MLGLQDQPSHHWQPRGGADSFRPPSAGLNLTPNQAQAPTCVAWWPRRRPGWPLPQPLPVMGLKATCVPLSSLRDFGATGFSALATDSATRRFTTSRKPTVQPKVATSASSEVEAHRPQAGASQPPSAPSRGRLGVPPLPISRDPTPAASAYSHGTLAEILRRVFGTRASEVAQ
jgi:hypothetical protein